MVRILSHLHGEAAWVYVFAPELNSYTFQKHVNVFIALPTRALEGGGHAWRVFRGPRDTQTPILCPPGWSPHFCHCVSVWQKFIFEIIKNNFHQLLLQKETLWRLGHLVYCASDVGSCQMCRLSVLWPLRESCSHPLIKQTSKTQTPLI